MKFSDLRFTNIALLAFLLILTLTGLYGLFWTLNGWVFTIHRAAGWALLALLPWKIAIVIRSLRREARHGFNRKGAILISLFLAVVTAAVLGLGVLWNWRFGPPEYWLRQTAVSWHWMLALALLFPLAVHTWQRWPSAKRVDFLSRRAALRLAWLAPLTVLGYLGAEALARQREQPQAPRRITGSRREGHYSGNQFPVTHNRAADPAQVDPAVWRLTVLGHAGKALVLNYEELSQLATQETDATLDCTLGWYTQQIWRGIPLVSLLAQTGATAEPAAVRLESVTGYAHILLWAEAKDVLLATHVGGETLDFLHGFPLRAVVPSRRGWFWVKWLAKVEVIEIAA